MSSSLTGGVAFGSRTISASGRSPHRTSWTPITAHSVTPAMRVIRSSSWSDETHSPPRLDNVLDAIDN
jgi:hypothetical protein